MHTTVLTQNQIIRIHKASLAILERTGVVIPHREMLSRFADSGAAVDFAAERVRIPSALVEKSIAQAGKKFTMYGRDRSKTAEFGVGRQNFNSIAGEALWLEEVGGQRRYATMADVATASRFADALTGIDMAGAMSDPHEVPASYRCVEVMATMLKNTTKPIHFWFHDRPSARFLVDMSIALRGSEQEAMEFPVTYPFLEPISPLRFPSNGVDQLFETARLNLPVPIGPMAQMGLSAPATVAGTMAQENAEILAGICITQLIRPGMPVMYGGICHAFDMRTTQMIFAGPEQAIFGVAMTQMGKSYGLPVYVNVGLTDSKRPDAQAGIECAATLISAASAGADILGHMGICGVDQATSLDMLVMQDELIGYMHSALREIDFSDEAFGLDTIDEVGPGGTFIATDHTADHFRKELHFPKLLDRQFYQAWLESGATSMEDRCRERKQEILKSYQPEPMEPSLERELDGIVEGAKRELGA